MDDTPRNSSIWQQWDRLNGHAPPAEPEPLQAIALDPVGIAAIPPRRWAYGRFLLFGSAAVLGALDGAGKGTIATSVILAQITGRLLLGERVWRSGPVAIISYEDDLDEWHRRIAAACDFHGVDYDLALRSIRFLTFPSRAVCFARMDKGQPVFPDRQAILGQLRAMGAVLLLIDPFNHAHALDDGNNNAAIAKVAGEISLIARESGCAVMLLHHLRKGAIGEPDDLMGATSLRATFAALASWFE